jgi:adenylosuccinate synthase
VSHVLLLVDSLWIWGNVHSNKVSFHLLPSGLTNPECMNIIGSGVVVNIKDFFNELEALEGKGLQNVRERIVISDRCHVVLDLHQMVDGLEEAELQGKSLGTTGKGIGPTYQTKAARNGIRVSDIFNKELFDNKVRNLARGLKKRYGDLLSYDPEEEIARYNSYRAQLADFVCDVVPLINDVQSKNLPLLVEGANALLLDIDYGSYPVSRRHLA